MVALAVAAASDEPAAVVYGRIVELPLVAVRILVVRHRLCLAGSVAVAAVGLAGLAVLLAVPLSLDDLAIALLMTGRDSLAVDFAVVVDRLVSDSDSVDVELYSLHLEVGMGLLLKVSRINFGNLRDSKSILMVLLLSLNSLKVSKNVKN